MFSHTTTKSSRVAIASTTTVAAAVLATMKWREMRAAVTVRIRKRSEAVGRQYRGTTIRVHAIVSAVMLLACRVGPATKRGDRVAVARAHLRHLQKNKGDDVKIATNADKNHIIRHERAVSTTSNLLLKTNMVTLDRVITAIKEVKVRKTAILPQLSHKCLLRGWQSKTSTRRFRKGCAWPKSNSSPRNSLSWMKQSNVKKRMNKRRNSNESDRLRLTPRLPRN